MLSTGIRHKAKNERDEDQVYKNTRLLRVKHRRAALLENTSRTTSCKKVACWKMIRNYVESCSSFIKPRKTLATESAKSSCPARIDLAGGWSDTPPICSIGGKVVNVAVKLDGQRPIYTSVKRIDSNQIQITSISLDKTTMVEYSSWQNVLDNYSRPEAQGSLVLACLALLERFVPSISSLGLQITTSVTLPVGSGLGTSSILAATILSAIGKVYGLEFPREDLIHAVLVVEQLLTTGGGWQDQVGGVFPGFKLCQSSIGEPLQVSTLLLTPPDNFVQKFQNNTILIYTGTQRLAKNLLTTVLSNFAGGGSVKDTISHLIRDAESLSHSLSVDLDPFPSLITLHTSYYHCKKVMAGPQSEPPHITQLIDTLQNTGNLESCSLAGAGGGGYLICMGREPWTVPCLPDGMTCHSIEIDNNGLIIE